MSLSQTSWSLASPNGEIEITVSLTEAGEPQWAVRYRGEEVLSPSPLGLEFQGQTALAAGMQVLGEARGERDETYPLRSGKASSARDHHRELRLALAETEGARRRLELDFRAFDDAAAFRYRLPDAGVYAITAERTAYRFPGDFRCWALELENYQTPYESEFHPRTMATLTPDTLIGFPLTLQTPSGVALALTEACLVDYAGQYVVKGDGTSLETRLSPLLDGSGGAVRVQDPHASPWRVLLVAPTPAQLIESNVVLSLNPPEALADASWVKPGKVTWDWWSGSAVSETEGGMNDATMRHYMNFAAEMGLEYMLIDGGWYPHIQGADVDLTRSVPEIHLPELVQYARERGVDTLVWMHQKDTHGQLETAFAYYEQIGVRGVKVDFFDRDDQEIVNYCRHLVEVAARHQLHVDLHGIHKPTGWSRTWPNLMTYEGIMGAEYNKWSSRITPAHNVTIPYTRMLAGPMDYTPGGFGSRTPAQFEARNRMPLVMGTRCHQLAMYVVYESGLQMVSDYPNAIRGQTGADFLGAVPAAWDETRALGGSVGEWIALARRRGNDWFLGAMTNESGRTITLPLDFLGEGHFTITQYTDGPDVESDATQTLRGIGEVSRADRLTWLLGPSGGAVAHLQRQANDSNSQHNGGD